MRPCTYRVNLNCNIGLPMYIEIKETEKYCARKELV